MPSTERQLTIGIDELRHSYPVRRNCSAPVPGVTNRRVYRLPADALPGLSDWLFEGLFLPLHTRGVDLIHLWNRVSPGRLPWGVSYESRLPRIAGDERRPRVRGAIEGLLRRDSCRFVAPISGYAERRLVDRLDTEDVILSKIHRVPPHQEPLVSRAPEPVSADQPLNVVMVGHDFLRKGGEAVLDAVDQVGEELDVHLSVVSSVARLDYACPTWDQSRLTDVRRRLTGSPRVTWHPALANPDVIELLRRSQLGVLPTLADTYGYSLLEYMACGLPVVGTNVQAGPEIVDDTVGWRIEVDTDSRGDWTGMQLPPSRRHRAYDEARGSLADQLVAVLRQARVHPATTARRGAAALDKVMRKHGSQRAELMRKTYAGAVGL